MHTSPESNQGNCPWRVAPLGSRKLVSQRPQFAKKFPSGHQDQRVSPLALVPPPERLARRPMTKQGPRAGFPIPQKVRGGLPALRPLLSAGLSVLVFETQEPRAKIHACTGSVDQIGSGHDSSRGKAFWPSALMSAAYAALASRRPCRRRAGKPHDPERAYGFRRRVRGRAEAWAISCPANLYQEVARDWKP